MRWSLILSAFIAVQSALSFVCVALAIPPQSEGLERRAKRPPTGPKLPSKVYRKNSEGHFDAYHVHGLSSTGKITEETKVEKERLTKGKERQYGQALLTSPGGKKLHADHVFEVQMLNHHLQQHGIAFGDLNARRQKKVQKILNGSKNMAIIPGSINQSKGQLIKHGMEGKQITRKKARDDYALKSYDTAHKTAGKLDKVLKNHPGYSAKVGDNTLQQKLKDTFVAAGLHPGTATSSRHSSSASSRSSSSNQGHSNSRQSSPRPSTPGPSSSSSNRGPTNKRQASPGNSPPKTRQKTGRK